MIGIIEVLEYAVREGEVLARIQIVVDDGLFIVIEILGDVGLFSLEDIRIDDGCLDDLLGDVLCSESDCVTLLISLWQACPRICIISVE